MLCCVLLDCTTGVAPKLENVSRHTSGPVYYLQLCGGRDFSAIWFHVKGTEIALGWQLIKWERKEEVKQNRGKYTRRHTQQANSQFKSSYITKLSVWWVRVVWKIMLYQNKSSIFWFLFLDGEDRLLPPVGVKRNFLSLFALLSFHFTNHLKDSCSKICLMC